MHILHTVNILYILYYTYMHIPSFSTTPALKEEGLRMKTSTGAPIGSG